MEYTGHRSVERWAEAPVGRKVLSPASMAYLRIPFGAINKPPCSACDALCPSHSAAPCQQEAESRHPVPTGTCHPAPHLFNHIHHAPSLEVGLEVCVGVLQLQAGGAGE